MFTDFAIRWRAHTRARGRVRIPKRKTVISVPARFVTNQIINFLPDSPVLVSVLAVSTPRVTMSPALSGIDDTAARGGA